jgi:Carboxypeptidase regulatory-like domain
MLRVSRVIRLVAMGAVVCTGLWAQAQSTAQISGTIQDASGSAVPGADVKATQTDTGAVRATVSGPDGVYVLPNLPIGPYRLEVGKQGFNTYVQTGIVLQVATNPTVDVTLRVGAVSEQVEVQANAALVDTQTTGVGQVIENQRILELPLNGRQATDLLPLAGAAAAAGKHGTAGMPGGQNISIAGGQSFGVGYYLDGAQYNNPFDATNLPFPFPDALQEFKVETSTLTAQNGMHSAAAVNAVVKSGTNSYHGDLFEFLRNGDMNARNFFATSRDSLKRNQYGGTFGGPIKKDRLFFFGGYQGTRTRQDPTDQTAFIPSAQMLSGNFSGCGFPALKDPSDPTGKTLFPNNRIPVSLFSSQALAVVKQLPATADPCGKVIYGAVTKINEYQLLGKVDYQISEKHSIFGRYMATTYYLPAAYSFSQNLLSSTQGGLDDLAQSITIGDTFLISPNTVNSFRASVNRIGVHRFNADYFSGCDIGVNMTCYIPHQTVLSVTNQFSVGIGTAIQASFIPSIYQLGEDISLVRGSHQLGFGVTAFKYGHSQKANVFSAGSFTFNGTATGAGLADLLLGQLGSFTQGVPNSLFARKLYVGMYGQDTWKLSPRLTVNVGVRWEPFLPEQVTNGDVYTFDYNRFLQGVRSTVFKNAPAGFFWPGDPGFADSSGVNRRWDQFAPRVGVAWDPQGNGRTSVRASFGLSYDFPNIQLFSQEASAPPFGDALTIPGPVPFGDPFATSPGGNFFPVPFNANAPFTPFGTFISQNPNIQATTVLNWNLGVQRQLGKDWLVSATYMGLETEHLWVSYQLNPGQFLGLGPCTLPNSPRVWNPCSSTANTNFRRLFNLQRPQDGQYIGPEDTFDSGGTASYHGLILALEKRLSRHFSANANYTWSHCIGDATQGSTVGSAQAGLLDPNNRRFDRGNCSVNTLAGTFATDQRQIFNFTAVAETPSFSNRAVRAAGTGWQVAGILRKATGGFLTPTLAVDQQLTGTGGQRPNQVLPDPLCANPNPACWINKNAFSIPALGTLGSLGRASIPGPGFWELDMSLTRNFRVREKMVLQLRGEAFNLTNSFRAGIASGASAGAPGVNLNVNSPQFGQILNALDPRILQVAAKFAF